jgi:hypothetical protein
MPLFRRSRKPVGKPGEWFYCIQHGKVEEGPECPAKDRLGPYPSRADAGRAMEISAERNEDWETDPRWHDKAREGQEGQEEQ